MAFETVLSPADIVHQQWDAAYLIYEGRKALLELDETMGVLANAQWDFDASRKGETEKAVMQEAETTSYTKYGYPALQAATALIAIPAPTVAAALEKMRLATHWDLTDDFFSRPVVDLIAEDIERLTGVRKGGAA